MSRSKPNIVFVIFDDEHRELVRVVARHKKGAMAVAKALGIDGEYAREDKPSDEARRFNYKGWKW